MQPRTILFFFVILLCASFLWGSFNQPIQEKKAIPITTKSEKALGYYHKAMFAVYSSYEAEALKNIKLAVETDPEFVMARTWYARFLDVPDALKIMEETKAYFDKVSEGEKLFALAIEAQVKNDLEKEIELLKKIISQYPEDGTIYNELGRSYFQNKVHDKSVEAYEKAIACNPEIFGAYNDVGYACIRAGRFEDAIKWLQKYAQLMPQAANPLDSLGDAYRQAGRYKEAWDCYQKALKVKPDFTASLLHLGDVKQELGYYEEAVGHYQECLKSLIPERDISESHFNMIDSYYRPKLAQAYLLMNNLEKAEEEIKNILTRNTGAGNVLGHYLAGELALRRGDAKKAREEADLAQRFEKENNLLGQEKDQIVNFLRAKVSMAEGDLSQAEKFLVDAINAFGMEGQSNLLSRVYSLGDDRLVCAEPLNLLAEIKKREKKVDEEVLALKRSLLVISHQPQPHFRLFELYSGQQKSEQAVRECKIFLNLAKEHRWNKEDIEKAKQFLEKTGTGSVLSQR